MAEPGQGHNSPFKVVVPGGTGACGSSPGLDGELQLGNLLCQLAHLYPVEPGKLCHAFDGKYDFTRQDMIRQSRGKSPFYVHFDL